MKFLSTVFLIVLISFPSLAQIPPPVLVAEIEGKTEPLLLSKVKVDVRIFGVIAETRMTLTFFNGHERQLSGDLYFPLPEGATISGYALDVSGVMVDGVVVEKQRGRVVFEDIVRKGIDPGLVEWVKGNSFKTRVFPIPPRSTRTVMVRYLSELVYQNKNNFYYLPLKYDKKVKEFSIRVEVVKAPLKPVVKEGGPADFQFARWRDSYVAEAELRDSPLEEDLVLALPGVEKQKVYVEKSSEGDYYVCIQNLIEEFKGKREESSGASKHIAILWDASGSMGKADHRRELDLLRSYFKELNSYGISVDLTFFRNTRSKPKRFLLEDGNIEELIRNIEEVEYDGGTQMGCISPTKEERIPDFYLLFSDGLSNFGQEEPTGWKAPLYIFSGSSLANHSFLRYLGLKTGGAYFNLKSLDDRSILNSIGISSLSFISSTVDSGTFSEIYPKRSRLAQGRLILAGKLLSQKANITLNYGIKGKILKKVTISVSKSEAFRGDLLKTFWAQKKVEDLQIFQKRNKNELIETGKKYGLVTPDTSLIVLEDLSQYVEYQIPPPKSLPKMRQQYNRIMDRKKTKVETEDKLEYVLQLWKERVEWWNTDFLPAKPIKKEKEEEERRPAAQPDEEVWRILTALIEQAGQAIGGAVIYEDGTLIPGAAVTLTNTDTDVSLSAVSNEYGIFIFSDIPAGNYRLRVELEGFMIKIIDNIRLMNGDKLRYPVTLSLGRLMEEITCSVGVEGGANKGVAAGVEARGFQLVEHWGGPAISLKKWDPQTPYLEELRQAKDAEVFSAYLEQKKIYGQSPAFFLDCADFFFERKQTRTGLQVLSNVAEIELENASLLRVLAHRLRQLGLLDLSAMVFEEVLKLRPEEPHSYRDLALVQDGLKNYKRAVELLYRVVMSWWSIRFQDIELIALMELNNIIARATKAETEELNIDPRLIQLLDVDIRIVMTWDADLTDIDLWVIEPSGEKAFYGHHLTSIGGLVSRDFTEGYGPEEYVLKKAVPGIYEIKANYYGSDAPELLGPITLQVDIFTNYGRKDEKKKSITLRLKKIRDVISVGEIEYFKD